MNVELKSYHSSLFIMSHDYDFRIRLRQIWLGFFLMCCSGKKSVWSKNSKVLYYPLEKDLQDNL